MDSVRYVNGWGKVILHNLPFGKSVKPQPIVRHRILSYQDMQKPPNLAAFRLNPPAISNTLNP